MVFSEIGLIPRSFHLNRLGEGAGMEKTMIAVDKYSNDKLKRALKAKQRTMWLVKQLIHLHVLDAQGQVGAHRLQKISMLRYRPTRFFFCRQ